MKLVTSALASKNLSVTDLPEDLQERIQALIELEDNFNQTADEYEADPEEDKEIEKKLDETEDLIASTEAELAKDIKEYTPQAASDGTPAPKKEGDSSVGWLIFGGIALVATLGAVNLFKKK